MSTERDLELALEAIDRLVYRHCGHWRSGLKEDVDVDHIIGGRISTMLRQKRSREEKATARVEEIRRAGGNW